MHRSCVLFLEIIFMGFMHNVWDYGTKYNKSGITSQELGARDAVVILEFQPQCGCIYGIYGARFWK